MNRLRLLTFDAFGTLFAPKPSIGKQYADVAHLYGLHLQPQLVGSSFVKAFKEETQRCPNYGKALGMDASHWWANVIRSTFIPFTSPTTPLHESVVPHLLMRFSSSQGYELEPHVLDFFHQLQNIKTSDPQKDFSLTVGVITNSDDRVPSVLSSLGLGVGHRRHGMSLKTQPPDLNHEDINFVTMSYDVGFEKPDSRIFDAARELGSIGKDRILDPSECIHVGDNVKKDFEAAQEAGWKAILVTPNPDPAKLQIESLSSLMTVLNSFEY